jgi:hypothetical protein
VARPKAGWPNIFFELVAWFPYQSGDARVVGSSTASSNEIPDDASESLSPAALCARHSSSQARVESTPQKKGGWNLSNAAGENGISESPIAAATPSLQALVHSDGCGSAVHDNFLIAGTMWANTLGGFTIQVTSGQAK